MPKTVSVYQLGSRMHYAVPTILEQLGMLDKFYTDICGNKGWVKGIQLFPDFMLPLGLVKLKNRKPQIKQSKIIQFPFLGLEINKRLKHAATLDQNLEVFIWGNKAFAAKIIEYGLPQSNIVYSYNTASLELFEAHGKNTKKILEQTIAPFIIEKEIVQPELEKYGDWVTGNFNYDSKVADEFGQRELLEMKLADHIVCGSQFVADSIEKLGGAQEKCTIIPYGVYLDIFKQINKKRKTANRKLQVLTVGRVGLRKGIQYIYEAAKKLNGVAEFTVVGPLELSEKGIKEVSEFVKIVPGVSKTRLLDFYNDADVFLLPSLCEGSATVIYEAMACNLPVITTFNSGSIITHNKEGLIIPIKDSFEIVHSVEKFLNPEFLNYCSEQSNLTAVTGSIEQYKTRMNNFFNVIK